MVGWSHPALTPTPTHPHSQTHTHTQSRVHTGNEAILKIILRSRLPKDLAQAVDREAAAQEKQARTREEKRALMRATCTVGVVGGGATPGPMVGAGGLTISLPAGGAGDGGSSSLDSLTSPVVLVGPGVEASGAVASGAAAAATVAPGGSGAPDKPIASSANTCVRLRVYLDDVVWLCGWVLGGGCRCSQRRTCPVGAFARCRDIAVAYRGFVRPPPHTHTLAHTPLPARPSCTLLAWCCPPPPPPHRHRQCPRPACAPGPLHQLDPPTSQKPCGACLMKRRTTGTAPALAAHAGALAPWVGPRPQRWLRPQPRWQPPQQRAGCVAGPPAPPGALATSLPCSWAPRAPGARPRGDPPRRRHACPLGARRCRRVRRRRGRSPRQRRPRVCPRTWTRGGRGRRSCRSSGRKARPWQAACTRRCCGAVWTAPWPRCGSGATCGARCPPALAVVVFVLFGVLGLLLSAAGGDSPPPPHPPITTHSCDPATCPLLPCAQCRECLCALTSTCPCYMTAANSGPGTCVCPIGACRASVMLKVPA